MLVECIHRNGERNFLKHRVLLTFFFWIFYLNRSRKYLWLEFGRELVIYEIQTGGR